MELQCTNLDNDIRLLKLTGKVDVADAGEIETRFPECCTGKNVRVIVDLSEVSYLASLGIRIILSAAKSVEDRGGRMVLLNPIREVRHVLEVTGITTALPIYDDMVSAQKGVLAS